MSPNKLRKLSKNHNKDKIIDKNGYVLIYCPTPLSNIHYRFEHTLVIESLIGRMLDKNEVIHHINFCKSDNSPENLCVFPNQKAHSHWHRQFSQFGSTQPLRTQIKLLRQQYGLE
jgi:hypothetical protein